MKALILLAGAALSVLPRAAHAITIVRNGKTDYAIVYAANAPLATRHGAAELQSHIQKMSGAALPILEAGTPEAARHRKHIEIRTDPALANEEYRVTTAGDNLVISGGGVRGPMYGCYALLEDGLGVRWYNTRITRVPQRKTVSLKTVDLRGKPAFEYREPYYTEAFDGDWAARNRCNGSTQRLDEERGGRVTYGQFVHTFSSLIPPDEYFDTHPEYFSEINGKRMKGYYQLCLTNPDVLRITIDKVRQWIKERPDATIFSVSQNDTYGYCQCPNCKAVEKEEGAPSGVVLRFVNQVADAIAKDHPNVLIDTLAYQWTEDPPLHVRPHPNVRVRLAPIGACVAHALDGCDQNKKPLQNLESWGKITNQLYIWHYSTNFANYLQPLPDLDEIPADIALFHKNGVVGLFYEGDYAQGGGGEMSELKAYLMAKLMWDPSRPAQPIIDDYLSGVYGKAAPYIQQWLDALHEPERKQNVHAHIYDPPTAPYLSDALLAKGDTLFDAAERAAAGDAQALDEVQRARLAMEYVQMMRAAPRYAIVNGVYGPSGGGRRDELVDRVMAKIKKYGITMVREWESLDKFDARAGVNAKTYPVTSIENAKLQLDVVPGLGGRIVRLTDKATGRNLLREPGMAESGYPAAAGYEEYTGSEYRSAGWNEAYSPATGDEGTLRMVTRLPNGLIVNRTYTLEGGTLNIRTTATNGSTGPLTVTLRAHPEFSLPAGSKPRIVYKTARGRSVSRELSGAEKSTFLQGDDLPAGAWAIAADGTQLTQSFQPAQVSQALLNASVTGGRVNLELYGQTKTLAPNENVTLEQSWTVTHPIPEK